MHGAAIDVSKVGTESLDWPNLGFEYRQTASFVQCEYKDGKWGALERKVDPFVKVHIGGTALHYGQACFEGMKAFQCKDKKVRIFRPEENAARIARSCERVCMPVIPQDKFIEACSMAVRDNLGFVPPYGTNGALYIRPVLFGSGPRIGLQPSDEYIFIVLVIPVADYYKGEWRKSPSLFETLFWDDISASFTPSSIYISPSFARRRPEARPGSCHRQLRSCCSAGRGQRQSGRQLRF